MTPQIDTPALRAAIAARPWSSLACAFAAGGLLAYATPRRPIARAAASMLGAIALAALRDSVTRGLATQARSWIDERVRSYVAR
jgi:hypothetical protein